MNAGEKCRKVCIRLLGYRGAVGTLMADGKGQRYVRRVPIDGHLSGIGGENAREATYIHKP